jgi:hypothetical protein
VPGAEKRRVPAQAGWIVDLPHSDQPGSRALWAVVEWDFNPGDRMTSVLCLGPLGQDLEGSAGLYEVTHPDLRVRFASDQMSAGQSAG